jgi:hypothetical protein
MESTDRLRQGLLAALGSPERVKAYLQWAVNKIPPNQLLAPSNLLRFRAVGGPAPAPAEKTVLLQNKALYAKPYCCLFDRVTFQAIRVKSSFTRGETGTAGAGEDRDLLHLLFNVQICPQCHFASGDKNQFLFESADPDKEEFAPADRQARLLAERFSARAALAATCGKTLYTEGRTPKDALVACQIAVLCAKALYEGDPRRDPVHLRSVARYLVNAAQLCRHLNDDAGALDHRRQAMAVSQEAFSLLQGIPAYETLYLIVRLACELDDAASVQQYGLAARRLFDGRNQIDDSRERTALDKFLRKINGHYEDFFSRRGEDRHIMNI